MFCSGDILDSLNYTLTYIYHQVQNCDIMMNIRTHDRVHFWIHLLNQGFSQTLTDLRLPEAKTQP